MKNIFQKHLIFFSSQALIRPFDFHGMDRLREIVRNEKYLFQNCTFPPVLILPNIVPLNIFLEVDLIFIDSEEEAIAKREKSSRVVCISFFFALKYEHYCTVVRNF